MVGGCGGLRQAISANQAFKPMVYCPEEDKESVALVIVPVFITVIAEPLFAARLLLSITIEPADIVFPPDTLVDCNPVDTGLTESPPTTELDTLPLAA